MYRCLSVFLLCASTCMSVCMAQQIRKSSTPKEIKHFLKDNKADKIVFSDSHIDVFQLRNKKSKKWGIYDWFDQLIPMEYDTIFAFQLFQPFTLAKKENRFVILPWPYDAPGRNPSFIDEFEDLKIKKSVKKDLTLVYHLLASKNGQWGRINWRNKQVLIDFKYATSQEVPLTLPNSRFNK